MLEEAVDRGFFSGNRSGTYLGGCRPLASKRVSEFVATVNAPRVLAASARLNAVRQYDGMRAELRWRVTRQIAVAPRNGGRPLVSKFTELSTLCALPDADRACDRHATR